MRTTALREMPPWQNFQGIGSNCAIWMHPDLQPGSYLYRYLDILGSESTFKNSSFRMKKPECWNDPYEQWRCQKLLGPNSQLSGSSAFGLCWTTRNRDEPFWRIYTNPQSAVPAIRLRTTVKRLIDTMTALVEGHQGEAFLGRVRYASEKKLEHKATQLFGSQRACEVAEALNWKRSQFLLEREVRLLWVTFDNKYEEYFDLKFDPYKTIDQVMIGPTICKEEHQKARKALIMSGVPEKIICGSRIYEQKVGRR